MGLISRVSSRTYREKMPLNVLPGDASSSDSETEQQDTRPDAGGKASRRQAQLEKIRQLRGDRNVARKMNRQAVQEEDRLAKLPTNHEARQQRAQWKLDEIARKEKAADAADDYEL